MPLLVVQSLVEKKKNKTQSVETPEEMDNRARESRERENERKETNVTKVAWYHRLARLSSCSGSCPSDVLVGNKQARYEQACVPRHGAHLLHELVDR